MHRQEAQIAQRELKALCAHESLEGPDEAPISGVSWATDELTQARMCMCLTGRDGSVGQNNECRCGCEYREGIGIGQGPCERRAWLNIACTTTAAAAGTLSFGFRADNTTAAEPMILRKGSHRLWQPSQPYHPSSPPPTRLNRPLSYPSEPVYLLRIRSRAPLGQ